MAVLHKSSLFLFYLNPTSGSVGPVTLLSDPDRRSISFPLWQWCLCSTGGYLLQYSKSLIWQDKQKLHSSLVQIVSPFLTLALSHLILFLAFVFNGRRAVLDNVQWWRKRVKVEGQTGFYWAKNSMFQESVSKGRISILRKRKVYLDLVATVIRYKQTNRIAKAINSARF